MNILDIKKVLEKIQLPDTKKNLVESNSVEEIEVKDKTISLKITITNPALHAKKRIDEAVKFQLHRKGD